MKTETGSETHEETPATVRVFKLKQRERREPRAATVGRSSSDEAEGEAKITIVGRPGGQVRVIGDDGSVEVLHWQPIPKDFPRVRRGVPSPAMEMERENARRHQRHEQLRRDLHDSGSREETESRTAPAPPPPRSRRSR